MSSVAPGRPRGAWSMTSTSATLAVERGRWNSSSSNCSNCSSSVLRRRNTATGCTSTTVGTDHAGSSLSRHTQQIAPFLDVVSVSRRVLQGDGGEVSGSDTGVGGGAQCPQLRRNSSLASSSLSSSGAVRSGLRKDPHSPPGGPLTLRTGAAREAAAQQEAADQHLQLLQLRARRLLDGALDERIQHVSAGDTLVRSNVRFQSFQHKEPVADVELCYVTPQEPPGYKNPMVMTTFVDIRSLDVQDRNSGAPRLPGAVPPLSARPISTLVRDTQRVLASQKGALTQREREQPEVQMAQRFRYLRIGPVSRVSGEPLPSQPQPQQPSSSRNSSLSARSQSDHFRRRSDVTSGTRQEADPWIKSSARNAVPEGAPTFPKQPTSRGKLRRAPLQRHSSYSIYTSQVVEPVLVDGIDSSPISSGAATMGSSPMISSRSHPSAGITQSALPIDFPDGSSSPTLQMESQSPSSGSTLTAVSAPDPLTLSSAALAMPNSPPTKSPFAELSPKRHYFPNEGDLPHSPPARRAKVPPLPLAKAIDMSKLESVREMAKDVTSRRQAAGPPSSVRSRSTQRDHPLGVVLDSRRILGKKA